jgi:hypothetical protein
MEKIDTAEIATAMINAEPTKATNDPEYIAKEILESLKITQKNEGHILIDETGILTRGNSLKTITEIVKRTVAARLARSKNGNRNESQESIPEGTVRVTISKHNQIGYHAIPEDGGKGLTLVTNTRLTPGETILVVPTDKKDPTGRQIANLYQQTN